MNNPTLLGDTFPAAWLGYAPQRIAGSDLLCVRVCAYCPDKAEAERQAQAAECDVTHAICVPCYQKQLDALGLN